VTDSGKQALAQYGEAVQQYHAGGSQRREELERLQASWAEQFHVEPADASILGEFASKPLLAREAQKALEDCGISLGDVQAAIDRLYTAGLLAPPNGAGPLPPPTPGAPPAMDPFGG
jgi:hypothetical protein